jgi:hypothetical protein
LKDAQNEKIALEKDLQQKDKDFLKILDLEKQALEGQFKIRED